MCQNLKFSTAVTVAFTIVGVSFKPFSAYEVTQKLRELVNGEDIAFTDKSPESINGVNTFRVESQEVKDIINDFYEARFLTRKNNGKWFEYTIAKDWTSPLNVKSTNVATLPANAPTISMGAITGACPPSHYTAQVVTPPRQFNVSCSGTFPVKTNTALKGLDNKIRSYILARRGQQVYLKQIQSRFKGVSATCRDYRNAVSAMGFTVTQKSRKVSDWFLMVP